MISEVLAHHGEEDMIEQLISRRTVRGRNSNRNVPQQEIAPRDVFPVIFIVKLGPVTSIIKLGPTS